MAVRDLREKKCLITGAASGIGRATAVAASREGAELFLTDIQAELLQSAADEIRAAGGTVSAALPADVSDHAAVVTLAEEIHGAHGSMDVVMNVAGISTWGSIDRLTHDHWRRQVDVNLMGPIHVIECFVPPMIEAGRGGHLVNVSSAAGLFGLPWHAAYSAAKFGLRGISEVLRFDLRRHGIGVSLVCPGAVATPLVGTVEIVGVDRDDPRVRKLVQRFERHAKSPEQVAKSILTGVKKGRYMIYTSVDVRFGHFCQRKFAKPYEIAMQAMNDRLTAVAEAAPRAPRQRPDGRAGG
jgi:NAD(P)-dependent dehydrogenase (short-subunit alcohol dehydrogenase family)